MTNTTDKSILTAAGKALLAQLNAEEKPLVIDKMIFANVPNRPEFPQPDDVVPSDDVVHEAAVEQRGRLSVDSVIYSTTLTSQEGPFEFNWTGAYCSEYGVLVTIDHHALTPKTVDEPGVSGNTLVRSVVLEYKDIAEITNITVDASTWQYNATPRMKKMDDDVAQSIIDQNGKDWFIEDGFLVTPQASTFNIKAGAGYVSGNRVMLEFDRNVQVPNKPSFIYVDAHREGTPTGEQVTLFDFVITADEKDDYTDESGVKHFVCKVAQVLVDGSVSDLRPEGESASKNYVNDMTGQLGDEVVGGKIWSEQPDKSAKLGDIVPDLTEYLRISGTLYPMSLMASGEITAINLVGKPYTATVDGQNVYLLDHRYYSRDITHVAAFWAVGVGDETESIKQAIEHAKRTESLLQFENRKYSYSEPLVAKFISIAFNGATMNYTGPVKKVSFSWISRYGNEISASRMDDVTFLNENAALPMEMSHTQTVSIPDLPTGNVITAIGGSTAVEVDIPVSGVDIGDMIRMDYLSSNEFIGLTACCEESGVIKLYCSNYDYRMIPAEDISITFIIMKNPIHGLCIGGSMPSASKIRVVGYTGLSVGIGDGIAPVSGVELTGGSRIYYGDLDLQVSAAYGYGLEIPSRNNGNRFYFNTFPYNLYKDPAPRRPCTFHQLILGGVSNTFGRLCLESASSKEAMLVTHWANANEIENGYYEENQQWANDNETKISFEVSSSGNKVNMRGVQLTSIDDRGVDNDVNIIPSYYINGGGAKQPIAAQSLLYNGDFINGMNGWTNWGSANDLLVIDSPFGKALRAVLDQDSINVQQDIDIPSGAKVPYSAGVWVRTNIEAIAIYINGTTNGLRHDGDGEWQYISSTSHFDTLSHVQVRSVPGVSNLSGFVEIAQVSVVQGRKPFLPEFTNPEGSKSYNPPSLNAGEVHAFNIDVTGAKRGDFVTASSSGNLQNCILFGNVNADDTVTITIFNPTLLAVDLGSQTFKCIAQSPKR